MLFVTVSVDVLTVLLLLIITGAVMLFCFALSIRTPSRLASRNELNGSDIARFMRAAVGSCSFVFQVTRHLYWIVDRSMHPTVLTFFQLS